MLFLYKDALIIIYKSNKRKNISLTQIQDDYILLG